MQRAPILLVEDEDGHAALVQAVIDELDEAVVLYRVSNVDQAVDFLCKTGAYTSSPEPGLVLLDINLPSRSGYELLEEVVGNPQIRHIPVIIFSTAHSPSDVEKSLSLGAMAHIGKPWSYSGYEQVVREIVNMIPYSGK